MNEQDFLSALEAELQLLRLPFDRRALQTFAADCWPVAQWDAVPDAERWAREFIEAGRVTVGA